MKEYKTHMIQTNGNKLFIPGKYDVLSAIRVSRWTTEVGTMLPKSPQDILSMFAAGDSILVKSPDNILLGHAAATATYEDGSIEVGSIFTNAKYRHHGVGTLATKAVLEVQRSKHDKPNLFALANDQSGPMFAKMGGRVMKTSELSPDVWEFCNTCPKLPTQTEGTFMCCDTPYKLTNVSVGDSDYMGCGR